MSDPDPAAETTADAVVWARTLVGGLRFAGICDVVISPGSRSTPLVFAVHEAADLRLHTVIDERVAGFFALGQARITGRPTALICTSGTAGAHYYPAVIEASQAFVPLVIVTADRPPELQSSSAPQTIDQTRLYGAFSRGFYDLGLPDRGATAHAAVRRKAVQAVHRSMHPTPGPVHINMPARKPLEPHALASPEAPVGPRIFGAAAALSEDGLRSVAERLHAAQRPVIAWGPSSGLPASAQARLRSVCSKADAAVYAESTSQLRFGAVWPGDALGLLLGSKAFRRAFDPDLVVLCGAPATSGAWGRWLAQSSVPTIAIAPHEWPDPSHRADTWLVAEPAQAMHRMADMLPDESSNTWRRRAADYDAIAWSAVQRASAGDSEGQLTRAVRASAPEGSVLMLGNSLTVRHFDTFCPSGGSPLTVLSQRGANGIDGLIAGAVGAASVSEVPVTLVLGDVSFQHDVGALAMAGGVSVPLVIVVVDNDGGRIFDILPAGRRFGDQPVFQHFTTPPAVDASIASAFGLRYVRADGPDRLTAALATAYDSASATVIQACVPPTGAVQVADRIEALLDVSFEGMVTS
ncbi:MAG: 2-succinyl-5-enolpyruvyl-6-hydroxy-3-cyclohexene-1-carboxylic-acid synthase [Myxococcota bacterium]